MKEIIIDGAAVNTREELHRALAEGLGFPEYYGNNLDALKDCLTDVFEETHITVLNAAALEDSLGEYFGRLKRALTDADAESDRISVAVVYGEEDEI